MTTYRTPALKLSDSNVGDKVQLFRVGTFHHAEYGKFNITPELLKTMEQNFKLGVRGVDLAIDYRHDSEDVAAGWIKEVTLSEDGKELWATVEWTPNGSKVLSEKEFRYLSPEFVFDYQDNETLKTYGPTLLGAGLTNRPTIKKMEPVIELSEYSEPLKQNKEVKSMDPKKEIMALLDKMSPEQLAEILAKLKPAPESESPEMAEMKKKLADAEKQLADAAQAKACSEKKQAFAKLLSEGKVCKAQEEAYLSGDMVKFAELTATVKLSETGSGQSPAQPASPESPDAAQAEDIRLAQLKLTEKKAVGMDTAISLVLSENPELHQLIYG